MVSAEHKLTNMSVQLFLEIDSVFYKVCIAYRHSQAFPDILQKFRNPAGG